jgi:hypothetical protein
MTRLSRLVRWETLLVLVLVVLIVIGNALSPVFLPRATSRTCSPR